MNGSDLRRIAEENLARRAASRSMAQQSAELLNHELRVHQIELEIQNEELRRIQLELEDRLSDSVDRFELAPVALVSHDRTGRVSELNRAAEAVLGMTGPQLKDRSLLQLMSETDSDRFHIHVRRAFDQHLQVRSFLELSRPDGTSFPALFTTVVAADVCITGIVDLTGTQPVRSTVEIDALLDRFAQRAIEVIGAENGVAWLGGQGGVVVNGAVLSAPITNVNGEEIGVIELYQKKTGTSFTATDKEQLRAIARATSIALERALAQAKIRDANEELREADRRQQDFLAALPREPGRPLAVVRAAIADLLEPAIKPAAAVDRVGGFRILVVDDNEDAAAALAMLLTYKGHEVTTALDGHEAVEHARAQIPDVIFMDVGMPKMDGIEAATRIRAIEACRQVHIVALTGWSQAEDRRRTQAAGIQQHLAKPASDADLEAVLAHYARSRQ